MATFTFDGPNKRILVNAELGNSSFTPAQVYSDWKVWVAAGNAQYEPAFSESVGGNDLGGGSSLDAYIFLRNDLGWRIRPDARDHTLTVDGNLFGADAGSALFAPTLTAAFVQIERSFSARAVGVATGGGSGPTTGQIAEAVWNHAAALDLSSRLTLVRRILENDSVTDPITGLMTVYADDGTTPLVRWEVFEDAPGTQPFRGAGINARRKL